jgi:alginate O-acetyltransferase complex protein AlgI
MLFNSYVFIFLFLPVTYGVFWMLSGAPLRYVWLTSSGYIFYGYWNPWFCLLMAFSTGVSFLAGLGFRRWSDATRRRLCLVIPITVDLLLLGFFKYANFGIDLIGDVYRGLQMVHQMPPLDIKPLDIVLPVGISFYTFHTITYIVDSYRGVIRPTRNLFEFSTYVSLFSQLVAGPIVRFRQIEEDLEHLGDADRRRWLRLGLSFFVVGLVQKVVVADTLAAFVNPALEAYHDLSTGGAWLAMLGYTFQLYFDFAGYSTMAMGLGYMFGLRIPINFNSPYKALDPSDFWRRWHISLSSCLRDYLYIPLGGNRGTRALMYRNLMLTMLIGGLWHGAGWTFIIWGAYHGVLLSAHRAAGAYWGRLPVAVQRGGMFVLVVLGWVFFRAKDLPMAVDLLRRMFVPTSGMLVPQPSLSVLALVIVGFWAMRGPNVLEMNHEWRPLWICALAAGFGASLSLIAGDRFSPFLYFQF